MGRFGWFITGLILGVILTLGALVYLKNARREAAGERAAAPIEAPQAAAVAPPAAEAPVMVAPPAPVAPRPAPQVRSRPAARQSAEEVAEDAAAVGMTTRRPPAPPRADEPITDVPY